MTKLRDLWHEYKCRDRVILLAAGLIGFAAGLIMGLAIGLAIGALVKVPEQWATWLAAAGTILVAIVAVLSHTVRFRLGAPRFEIEYDPANIDIKENKAWFHLQIRANPIKWLKPVLWQLPATNCRVMLHSVDGTGVDDSSWSPVLSPALQFRWPLSGREGPSSRNIAVGEEVKVDLGELNKNMGLFQPSVYQYKKKFGCNAPSLEGEHWGCLLSGQTIRYHVYFVCDQFVSPDYLVKIHWDGGFSEKRAELADHLKIAVVRAASSMR